MFIWSGNRFDGTMSTELVSSDGKTDLQCRDEGASNPVKAPLVDGGGGGSRQSSSEMQESYTFQTSPELIPRKHCDNPSEGCREPVFEMKH